MHRSRLPLLVIVAVAACSTRKESGGTTTLSQDSALATHLNGSQNTDQKTDKFSYPDVCGSVSNPDEPSDAGKARATALSRQAYNAEILGNAREASSLLQRASALDWTDKSAAYHLGRVSETLGERAAAIEAYCRFLALTPTIADGAEARRRLANLSQSQTRMATSARIDSSATRRNALATTAQREKRTKPSTGRRVVARASVARQERTSSTDRGPHAVSAEGAVGSPTQSMPVTIPPKVERRADSVVADGDRDPAPRSLPTVDQRPAVPTTERRGSSRVQTASIGAVAGAIIGGVAGRSVKAAAIGATAGGILGAVAPRGKSAVIPLRLGYPRTWAK